MCFGAPKIPKMEQKDPILPKQALQPTQPANLALGRVEGEDNKKLKANRSRRKLRVGLDKSTQVSGAAAGKTGGLQIGGM